MCCYGVFVCVHVGAGGNCDNRFGTFLPRISQLYGTFLPRISQLYAAPHAPCATLYLAPMPIGCCLADWCLQSKCCDRFGASGIAKIAMRDASSFQFVDTVGKEESTHQHVTQRVTVRMAHR